MDKKEITNEVEEFDELEVIGARCIVKEFVAEDKTKSGIIIAGTSAQVPTLTGTVLAVGEGAFLESGNIRPMRIKPGQTVMWAKFAGTPIIYDNEQYLMLNERDILVIVKKKKKKVK